MTNDDYPQLAEMGILHPLQIERYQVNSIANHDVLRVIYERGKDSFLPDTRTYKFPRVQKSATIGGSEQTVLETNPQLKTALDELERLLAKKDCKECVAETVLEELQALQDEIGMRSEYIRELVKKLGSS